MIKAVELPLLAGLPITDLAKNQAVGCKEQQVYISSRTYVNATLHDLIMVTIG
jgi:hypothetical protein